MVLKKAKKFVRDRLDAKDPIGILPKISQGLQNIVSPQPTAQQRAGGIVGGTPQQPTASPNVLPPEQPTQMPQQDGKTGQPPQIIRDQFQDVAGVVLSNGKRFFTTNKDDIRRLVEGDIRNTEVPEGTVEEQDVLQQQDIERQTQELMGQGLPERFSLDVPQTAARQVPIIGGILPFIGNLFGGDSEKVSNFIGEELLGLQSRDDIQNLMLDQIPPDQLEQIVLQKIQNELPGQYLTQSEKVGQFIEGIPAGKLIAKYAGTIETPGENANTVFQNIKKLKIQVINLETDTIQGYITVSQAQTALERIELESQRLKQRLKLLVINSPTLNFNSDELNKMETEIYTVDSQIYQSKLAVLKGKLIDPTEIETWAKLMQVRNFNAQ